MAEGKQIQINCDLANGLPLVVVDADRITQVFYNILVNALRYTPQQGQISVVSSLEDQAGRQWIKTAISDTGQGISQDDLPYVFDHFYRGDKSRDRKSGGSGIGLAIVKQLIESHGGKVTVESRIGEGSTFYVLLPVAASEDV